MMNAVASEDSIFGELGSLDEYLAMLITPEQGGGSDQNFVFWSGPHGTSSATVGLQNVSVLYSQPWGCFHPSSNRWCSLLKVPTTTPYLTLVFLSGLSKKRF